MSDVIRLSKKEKDFLTAVRSYFFEKDPSVLKLYGSSDRDILKLSITLAVAYLSEFDEDLINYYLG